MNALELEEKFRTRSTGSRKREFALTEEVGALLYATMSFSPDFTERDFQTTFERMMQMELPHVRADKGIGHLVLYTSHEAGRTGYHLVYQPEGIRTVSELRDIVRAAGTNMSPGDHMIVEALSKFPPDKQLNMDNPNITDILGLPDNYISAK